MKFSFLVMAAGLALACAATAQDRDFLTGDEHHDALRKAHDGPHDVLDQHDAYAVRVELEQHFENLVHLGV